MSDVERNKAVVEAFVRAINDQDWARLSTLVHPDFRRHSSAAGAPGIRSRDDLIAFLRGEYDAFPDAHETLEDLFGAGDRVAARHQFQGTQQGQLGPHPPSGRVMKADYIAIYRLVDGVIVESWVEWDNLTGLRQLGHVPAPTS